jgi:hypothetical protein
VLLERQGEEKNVVQVGETAVQFSQIVVHKALERPNGVIMAVFCISSGWTLSQGRSWRRRNARKLVRVIVDMTDGIEVWDCPGVECLVVAARVPTIVLLGYDV